MPNSNLNFYFYSQNCTNFISQVMYAGGLPMSADWYSLKLDGSNPMSDEELNSLLQNPTYSWHQTSVDSVSMVYSITNNPLFQKFFSSWDVSLSWSQVDENYEWLQNSGYTNNEKIYVSPTATSVMEDPGAYDTIVITGISNLRELQDNIDLYGVKVGDLIYFDFDPAGNENGELDGFDHAAVISSIDNGIISYSANTTNRQYYPLEDYYNVEEDGYLMHQGYIYIVKVEAK